MAICTLTTYIFLRVQRINRDYLTGVHNRQQFEDMVYARVAKWGTAGPFSLVLLDLNDFKFINDTHGHDAGDEVLITIARILIHSVQASDTVARLEEADEFRVGRIIERLLNNTERYNKSEKVPYRLSQSYGVATISEKEGRTYYELFKLADKRMYDYKRKLKESREG